MNSQNKIYTINMNATIKTTLTADKPSCQMNYTGIFEWIDDRWVKMRSSRMKLSPASSSSPTGDGSLSYVYTLTVSLSNSDGFIHRVSFFLVSWC